MRQSFGLTAFQLKLIAVVAMTLDHVGAYCGDISWIAPYASPLRVIGRIAMPVFLFLFVQSLRHTHSRPRLLLRLYLAGLLVELWDAASSFWEISSATGKPAISSPPSSMWRFWWSCWSSCGAG